MAALRAEVLGAKADPKSTDTDKPAQDDRTPEQINADDERRYRDYMAGVSQAFRQEPVEPRWATRVTDTLRQAIAADSIIRDFARDVDCPSHTCRVVLEETSANFQTLNKRLSAFVTSVVEALPTVSAEHTQDGHGSSTVVLYMSAPGDH
jgi:hypothetical protein